MSTRHTRRTGLLALASAGLWLAAGTIFVMDSATEVLDDWGQLDYLLFSIAILAAGVLALFAAIGMSKRHGGLGTTGNIGLALIGLGVVASIIAWAIPLWMGIQGVGYLLVGGSVLRRGLAPRSSTTSLSLGFLTGVATYTVLTVAEFGERDFYGDYPRAWEAGTIVAIGLVSFGLIGWGRWLRSDQPADVERTAVTA